MSTLNGEEKWRQLLREMKFFKDNVGRRIIWLTQTEVDIIDTPEFQRLRRIFQLGPAYLLYTGATGNRLEHSIGTLYKAKLIVQATNLNYMNFKQGREVGPRETFLTRLAALLHDIVFVTYGHILADEGRILPRQWADEAWVDKLLRDENSNIRKKITENVCGVFGKEQGLKIADEIMEQLINILSAKTEEEIKELGNLAFIADIVHNTICADLLDYLERDVHNTGTFGEYDSNILMSYFTIKEFDGQDRLVMKLYKRNVDEPLRWDIVSSILGCLRLRCDLAASVYLHHTRREASAMIIRMVSAALEAGAINREKIYELDDFYLPYFILNLDEGRLTEEQKKHLKIAKSLARSFLNRELYKPVWEISREVFSKDRHTMERLEELTDWKQRYEFENTLEKLLDVELGSTILYIPDPLTKKEPEMGLKEANVLVETKYGIDTLENLGKREEYKTTIGMEIDYLKSRHKVLFTASIFVSSKLKEGKKDLLAGEICKEWFENEVPSTIIEVIVSSEKIELQKKPIVVIAKELHEKFLSTAFRPGFLRFSEFKEYVSTQLKK
jgi:HD superfamily phosphohydrolase